MAKFQGAVVLKETGVYCQEEPGPGWYVFIKMGSILVAGPSLLTTLSLHPHNASPGKSKYICFYFKYTLNQVKKYGVYFLGSVSPDVHEWSVFVGPQTVNSSEQFELSVGVVRIIVSQMPGFNIALLKLARKVNYKDYIQPVCMDTNNERSFPVGTRCWVAGWDKDINGTGHFFLFLS